MLIVSDVDAYCMKCHQMWIDDDEGVTRIQYSVCNNWIHELCLPNDCIYSAKSVVFYCPICIT